MHLVGHRSTRRTTESAERRTESFNPLVSLRLRFGCAAVASARLTLIYKMKPLDVDRLVGGLGARRGAGPRRRGRGRSAPRAPPRHRSVISLYAELCVQKSAVFKEIIPHRRTLWFISQTIFAKIMPSHTDTKPT